MYTHTHTNTLTHAHLHSCMHTHTYTANQQSSLGRTKDSPCILSIVGFGCITVTGVPSIAFSGNLHIRKQKKCTSLKTICVAMTGNSRQYNLCNYTDNKELKGTVWTNDHRFNSSSYSFHLSLLSCSLYLSFLYFGPELRFRDD